MLLLVIMEALIGAFLCNDSASMIGEIYGQEETIYVKRGLQD